MPGERVRRQIDRFLTAAEQAMSRLDWATAAENARAALHLDPLAEDAAAFLSAAERALDAEVVAPGTHEGPNPPASSSPTAEEDDHTAATSRAPLPTTPASPAFPTSFVNGRYRIERFLGEGGRKKVYQVYDVDLDRHVAFALIKTEDLDDQGKTRIRREAQAMGRLAGHPHVVSVYDIGQENGQLYLVTELMRGGDIEGLLEHAPEHRLPIDVSMRLADQICDALECAHRNVIIHRDLKPGNVWLTEAIGSRQSAVGDDAGTTTHDPRLTSPQPSPTRRGSDEVGVAKIGDFGLAVSLDRTRLTAAGVMVGTVKYMPPEQALGGTVDARSDLYSLGAMLYEMVTGRAPFGAEDDVAIIAQHINSLPDPPTWYRPELPAALEELILSLLQKTPERRPASAAQVREALQRIDARESPVLTTQRGQSAAWGAGRLLPGRQDQVATLYAAFDRVCAGQCLGALISGLPGMGKSALVDALRDYVHEQGGLVVDGPRAGAEEILAGIPLRDFVERVLANISIQVPAQTAESWPSALADANGDAGRLEGLLAAALISASSAAAPGGLMLVLEELHRAGSSVASALVRLVQQLTGSRVLIVVTSQAGLGALPVEALDDLMRIVPFERVHLEPLDAAAMHLLLSPLLGESNCRALAETMVHWTEGHPLIARAIAQDLLDRGVIRPDDPRGWIAVETWPVPAPGAARDATEVWLSSLSARCRRLLSVATIIGRTFGIETLDAIADTPEDELRGHLRAALDAGVLEVAGNQDSDLRRFSHRLFHEVLRDQLVTLRQRRLHVRLGEHLESKYGELAGEHSGELGMHFIQALDAATLHKGLRYCTQGAEQATARGAHAEAVDLLEAMLQARRSAELEDDPESLALSLYFGESLLAAGAPQRALREVAPAAWTLAGELVDRTAAVAACRLALRALQSMGAPHMASPEDWRLWEERVASQAGDADLARVLALTARAQRLIKEGDMSLAQQLSAQAERQALDLGSDEAICWSALTAIRLGAATDIASAQSPAQAIARLAEDKIPAELLGPSLFEAGAALFANGNRAAAEAAWTALLHAEARANAACLALYRPLIQAWLAMIEGRLEQATDSVWQILALGHASGSPLLAVTHAGDLSRRLLVLTGRGPQPGLVEPVDSVPVTAGANLALNLAAAAASLEAAVSLPNRDALHRLVGYLEPIAGNLVIGGPAAFTSIARHLGAAAALLGDREQALAYYEQALAVCGRLRFRPELALTHLGIAELLLDEGVGGRASGVGEGTGASLSRAGEGQGEGETRAPASTRAEALHHLDLAIAEFREMKMQPALERALRHKDMLKA